MDALTNVIIFLLLTTSCDIFFKFAVVSHYSIYTVLERVVKILEGINRRGIDRVVEYIRRSNYDRAVCRSHHTYKGGLCDHSLEVYELMMERRGNLSEESVAICALLHDLGKTHCEGYECRGDHPTRAVAILDRCGLELTDDERFAIVHHHSLTSSYFSHSLRHCLSSADMSSTGRWRVSHPKDNEGLGKRVKNTILYLLSKS